MGWLVVSSKSWTKAYKKIRREIEEHLANAREDFRWFRNFTKDSLDKDFKSYIAELEKFKSETRVLCERSEYVAKRLLELEGKIAALEATHHKVGYVPVDAFKALSEGDIEQMAGVTEKVKDQLQQIVSLNEQLKAAGDPGVGLDGI